MAPRPEEVLDVDKLKERIARLEAELAAQEKRAASDQRKSAERIAQLEGALVKQKEEHERELSTLLNLRNAAEARVAELEPMLRAAGVSTAKTEMKLVFLIPTRCMHKGKDRKFKQYDEYPVDDFSADDTELYKQRGIIGPLAFNGAKPMTAAIQQASPGAHPAWAQSQVPARPVPPKHYG